MLVSQHHRYHSSSCLTHPTASNSLLQFVNWAKFWVSSSSPRSPTFTPEKETLFQIDTKIIRDTDIRSRSNYYDPLRPDLSLTSSNLIPTSSQRASLYRATCQKLRSNNHRSNLIRLGDVIHIRRFWDSLEKLIYYQEMCGSSHRYIAPSKRMPLNLDKPGSLFGPKRSRNTPPCHFQRQPRPSFSSSTNVYTLTTKRHIQILPAYVNCRIQPGSQVRQQTSNKFVHLQQQHTGDDDDDIPLGALSFS
ncbi:hypothetical protein BD408DRAFT_421589 [Parasitella parasitica]|nr:hypothetical protein BD408DRAFT_421589 [Parasitella parasitica]